MNEQSKKSAPKTKSIGEYIHSIDRGISDLAGEYVYISKLIITIIDDFRDDLTLLHKPKTGWIFPVYINCDDPECLECPHQVRWKRLFWNPQIGSGKFQSQYLTVDRSVIIAAGSKAARESIERIVTTKKILDRLLERRSEIRQAMKSTEFRAVELAKQSAKTRRQAEEEYDELTRMRFSFDENDYTD